MYRLQALVSLYDYIFEDVSVSKDDFIYSVRNDIEKPSDEDKDDNKKLRTFKAVRNLTTHTTLTKHKFNQEKREYEPKENNAYIMQIERLNKELGVEKESHTFDGKEHRRLVEKATSYYSNTIKTFIEKLLQQVS